MLEITGAGMGLMMTGVAVATGGLLLEAAILMMCRFCERLRSPHQPSRRNPFELG